MLSAFKLNLKFLYLMQMQRATFNLILTLMHHPPTFIGTNLNLITLVVAVQSNYLKLVQGVIVAAAHKPAGSLSFPMLTCRIGAMAVSAHVVEAKRVEVRKLKLTN